MATATSTDTKFLEKVKAECLEITAKIRSDFEPRKTPLSPKGKNLEKLFSDSRMGPNESDIVALFSILVGEKLELKGPPKGVPMTKYLAIVPTAENPNGHCYPEGQVILLYRDKHNEGFYLNDKDKLVKGNALPVGYGKAMRIAKDAEIVDFFKRAMESSFLTKNTEELESRAS